MTLDGSFVISKELGDDHKYRLHTIKISANIWSIRLIGLIYRHHSNSGFKAIKGQGPIGMIMMRLIYIIWWNEVDRRRAHSDSKEDWKMKLTSHV